MNVGNGASQCQVQTSVALCLQQKQKQMLLKKEYKPNRFCSVIPIFHPGSGAQALLSISSALAGSQLLKAPFLQSQSKKKILYNLSCAVLLKAIEKIQIRLLLPHSYCHPSESQQVNEAGFPFTGATLILPRQNCVDLCLVIFLSTVLSIGWSVVVAVFTFSLSPVFPKDWLPSSKYGSSKAHWSAAPSGAHSIDGSYSTNLPVHWHIGC